MTDLPKHDHGRGDAKQRRWHAIALVAIIAVVGGCFVYLHNHHQNGHSMASSTTTEPTYTFVSISTAKPGKLEELAALASRPGELMDEKLNGVIARQVGVDEARNAVVVWVTLDRKETLYDYLATEEGRADHGENQDMSAIIDTFEMFDLVPYSSRLR